MQTKKRTSGKNTAGTELFTLLKKDHDLVKDMLEEIKENRSDETFEKIKEELDTHMSGEEEYFYPLLKAEPSMETRAFESFEEHNLARSIVEQITDEEDDKVWLARVKVLTDVIEHHIEEEENEIFPEASKNLEQEQLDEAAEKIKELKNEKAETA